MSRRFPRLDEVFHAALAQPPEARSAYVADACGDDTQFRDEVEALLAHAQSGDGFLESPGRLPGDSLVGQRLGTYEIEALIGSGGMGDVYRARDLRLDRVVALKLLPQQTFALPSSLERFQREARAASALNHPNIVTIHEIGHVDGRHFIAQELVDGATLREQLNHGTLPFVEILRIGVQLATGLAAAESAGVVHRDLKPENVMLRGDGYVKILDFGLAKITSAGESGGTAGARTLDTRSGLVLGTTRYMSPEQARGESVDSRSDIFSLGVILYEMAAGASPFCGRSAADEIAALLTKEPAPLDCDTRGLPPAFAALVARALRKQPDARFQTARDLLDALHAIDSSDRRGAVRQGPWPRSWKAAASAVAFAVLLTGAIWWWPARTPTLTDADALLLTDFSHPAGDVAFDGRALKRALEIQLRQTPFLQIVSEESSQTALRLMRRASTTPITREIAREICLRHGFKAFLAGDVARLGTGYLVTLEAVAAESGAPIAMAQAEASHPDRLLGALGAAAIGLRGRLGESLATLERFAAPIEQATTSSLEALKAYSAGVELFASEQGQAAAPFLVRATTLDPQFVAAYDLGAWALSLSGDPAGAARFAEAANRLKERATERERISAETTYHHFSTGDLVEETRLCAVWKSLYRTEWMPSSCLALNYLYPMARFEDAEAEARAILRDHPEVAQGYRFLAPALMHQNRFDEAARVIADAQSRGLDNVFLRAVAYQLAFVRGDDAGVEKAFEEIRRHEGDGAVTRWRARAAAFSGRWREADSLFRQSGTAAEAERYSALVRRCEVSSPPMRALLNPDRIGRGTAQLFPVFGFEGSFCGDVTLAETFVGEMTARAPRATVAQKLSTPLFRASIAIRRGNPAGALAVLRAAGPFDDVVPEQSFLRGQAYLRRQQHGEAALAFRAIVDRRGRAPTSFFYPLAYIGLARAAMLAGDQPASRQAYETFFKLWAGADADLPILLAARQEYARLIR